MDPNDNQNPAGQDSGNTDDSGGMGPGDQTQDQPQNPTTPDVTTPDETPTPAPESNPSAGDDSTGEEIAPPSPPVEVDEPGTSSNDGSSDAST